MYVVINYPLNFTDNNSQNVFRDAMCGICGNMNDNINDDMMTSEGVDVTNQHSNRYSQIGNSWQVTDEMDEERSVLEMSLCESLT